ncbi:SOS response-associated peptidase [Phormidium sp. CCY1219]|uniref:SOS response-associated peptidase n=1 Tax=Phormidium sp. CCY1219 TaxID=2886104 RepID=UPI002D1F0F5F|nr:SOS response-associated peptidase [Phormidium sp. CCY1219]MEB3829122.1 SOS response-associated peptidase [Phormidium sp. CCY1219]
MCGRFSFYQSPETVAELFQLAHVPQFPPRYNIAPTQSAPTIRHPRDSSQRQFHLLRWGLIPPWAKDAKMGAKLINARAETVTEKPSFRSAFQHRRCLVLADGFYEWQPQPHGKQPFYFQLKNDRAFAFAGLWERWISPTGEAIASCTILTTQANQLLHPIHPRMPVILPQNAYDRWLTHSTPVSQLLPLLRPYPTDELLGYPVTPLVNNPKIDSAECIQSLQQ